MRTTVLSTENQGPGLPKLPVALSFDTGQHQRRYTPRRAPGTPGWMWVETFTFDGAPHVGAVSGRIFTNPLAAVEDADRYHGNHVYCGVLTAHRDRAREERQREVAESWANIPADLQR